MGYSYQDLAQRVEILEEKVNLALKSIRIQQSVGKVDPKMLVFTLEELYYATKQAGITPKAEPPTQDELRDLKMALSTAVGAEKLSLHG